ncbi:radical SAM protein [Vibrio phage V-YDF132]|nr:radical SAM protein [Vibrio phage V-YDF132]
MYIQITTACTMSCAHCLFSCGTDRIKVEHMPMRTFKRCLQIAENHGDAIALGGGEPTDHPKFWQMLGLAIVAGEHCWMATNGHKTDTALALLGLSSGSEKLRVVLSQDEWHDPIDKSVVTAYTDAKALNQVKDLTNHGSAYHMGLGSKDDCRCGGMFVRPNGDVYPCACSNAPRLCNVFDDDEHIESILGWLRSEYCMTQYQTLAEAEEEYEEDLGDPEDLDSNDFDTPIWEGLEAACGFTLEVEDRRY